MTIDPEDFTPHRIEAEVREKFGIATREELYSSAPKNYEKAAQARNLVGKLLEEYELGKQQKKFQFRCKVLEDFAIEMKLFMAQRNRPFVYWLTQTGRGRAIAATVLLILAFGAVVATQKSVSPNQTETVRQEETRK